MGHVISVDTTDAVEMGALPAGEYKVQILKAEHRQGEGASGHWEGILLTLDCPDEATGDFFSHMQFLPSEQSDTKRRQRQVNNFDTFKKAFGYKPKEDIDIDHLEGKSAWAHLTVEDNAEYGPRNRVRNWIVSQG